MKKLFAFIGFLLFTLVLYATPQEIGPDIPGVFIEQPMDLVTVENVDVTLVSIDFVIETPKLEGLVDDYSLNVNRYSYLFQEADLAFDSKYTNEINYLYREIELRNRPPNMDAKTLLSTNNYSNTKDGFRKALNKNILFGFWLC